MAFNPIPRTVGRLAAPLAMALALPLSVPAASADDLTIRFGYGHHGAHHADRHHHDKRHHGARSRHGRGHHAERRTHGHDQHGRYTSRDCRTVTKQAYHNGRPAKVSGKLCYDRHGTPYIVDGSRSVVGYYD